MQSFIRRFRAFLLNEQGAASVMVVLFLSICGLGFAALIIDASMIYAKRSQMITAADAGALAGAGVIREAVQSGKSPEAYDVRLEAEAEARNYAAENGADPDEVRAIVRKRQVTLPNGKTDYRQVIDVQVGVIQPSLFARVFGDDEGPKERASPGTLSFWHTSSSVSQAGCL